MLILKNWKQLTNIAISSLLMIILYALQNRHDFFAANGMQCSPIMDWKKFMQMILPVLR